MIVQKRAQIVVAARASTSHPPSESHPWKCGSLAPSRAQREAQDERERVRIEAARSARVSSRMEAVADQVEALDPVEHDVNADAALVNEIVAGTGAGGLAGDE